MRWSISKVGRLGHSNQELVRIQPAKTTTAINKCRHTASARANSIFYLGLVGDL